MATYGPNLIPATGWTLSNVSVRDKTLVFGYGGVASVGVRFGQFAALTQEMQLSISAEETYESDAYAPHLLVSLQVDAGGTFYNYTWGISNLKSYGHGNIRPLSVATFAEGIESAEPSDPNEGANDFPVPYRTWVTPVELPESSTGVLTIRMQGVLYDVSLRTSSEADAMQDFYDDYTETADTVGGWESPSVPGMVAAERVAPGTMSGVSLANAGTGDFTGQVTAKSIITYEPWTALTLSSGVSARSDYGGSPIGAPAYRVANGVCYIAGSVTVTPASSSSVELAVLPEDARPAGAVYLLTPCSGTRIARIFVSTSGVLKLEWLVNISDGTRYTSSTWVQINMVYPTGDAADPPEITITQSGDALIISNVDDISDISQSGSTLNLT